MTPAPAEPWRGQGQAEEGRREELSCWLPGPPLQPAGLMTALPALPAVWHLPGPAVKAKVQCCAHPIAGVALAARRSNAP